VRGRNELNNIRRYIADNPTKAKLPDSAASIYRATWIDEALA
jgi:hypothetical protein